VVMGQAAEAMAVTAAAAMTTAGAEKIPVFFD